jgi:hypothetical protein
VTEVGQHEAGVDELAVGGDQRADEREEADHDEPVGSADQRPAHHPGVTDDLADGGDQARARVVGAAPVRLAGAEHGHHPGDRRDEQRDAGDADSDRDGGRDALQDRRRLHGQLLCCLLSAAC